MKFINQNDILRQRALKTNIACAAQLAIFSARLAKQASFLSRNFSSGRSCQPMHFPVTDLPQPHSFAFVIIFPLNLSTNNLMLRKIQRHRSLTEQVSRLVISLGRDCQQKNGPLLSTAGLTLYMFRVYHSTHSKKRRYSQTTRGRLQNCIDLLDCFLTKNFC